MKKRNRQLNQRLEELFSSEGSAEAAPPVEPPAPRAAVPSSAIVLDAALVIEQLPIPAYVKDREHRWAAVNAAFCQTLQQSATALLGHVDKEQVDEAWQLDDRVLETGQTDHEQKTIPLPDGSLCIRSTRRVPLFDAEQHVTGVMGIIHETFPAREAPLAVDNDDAFRHAAEGMPSPMIISRMSDDVTVFANAAFSDLAGVPLDRIIGQTVVKFYTDPADHHKVGDIFQRQGEVHAFETRLQHSSGHTRWVSLDVRPIRFSAMPCVITNVIDITARKEAEVELTKFKLGIDRTNAAVTITDANGTIVYVNPAYEKIYGYTAEEVIGQNPRILKSGLLSPEQYKRFWAKLLSGQPVTGEIVNKAKDGHLVPVETNNTPIQDESGRIVGFLSIQYDITERKTAEAELRKFKLALDRSQAAIFITEPDGVITYVNPAFEQVYGFTPEEALGQTPRILKSGLIPPERYVAFWQTLLSGQAVVGEITNKAKDGRFVPIEASNNPILDENGRIIGFLGMHLDVTERKQAEVEREWLLNAEAKRALQLQTAATISNAVSTVLALDELLPFVVDLIRERFSLYYVGLFLTGPDGGQADLRAGTGEAGRQMLQQRYHLRLDDSSMIGWSITHRRARIALDVGADAVRFANPLLPETRSEVALPLISRGEVLGAMTAQSQEPAAFSDHDVAVLQSMAEQIANAIANAQLFEQSRQAQEQAEQRLLEVQFLQRVSQASSETLDPERVYDVVFEALETDLGFTHCALIVFNRQKNQALTVRATGTASGMQRLDRLMSDLENDIIMDIARRGKIEVIDGWDDRLDREIYVSQRHDRLVRAFVPLMLRGECAGLLEVGYQRVERATFTDAELRLLDSLADLIAVAVANTQLFEETGRRMTEMSILNEIVQAFARLQHTTELFETIRTQVNRLFDTRNFFIITYEGGNEWTSAYHIEEGVWQPPAVYPLGSGFTSHILRTGTSVLICSVAESQDFHRQHGLVYVGKIAKSWMGVPLLSSGKPVGIMGIQNYERESVYNDHDLTLFSTIAAQAVIALQNIRLYEETRLRANELAALNDLSIKLTERLDINGVLEEVYQGVSRLLDTTNFYIALYDAEHDLVSFPVNVSESIQDVNIEVMPASQGLTGHIIRHREPLLLNENIDEWISRMGLTYVGAAAQSWLGVPMLLGDQILGVVAIQSHTQARIYTQHDQDLLSAIAGQAAIALQNARLFEQTQRQAREAETINTILQSVVTQRADLTRLMEAAFTSIQTLLPVDAFIVAIYDDQTKQLTYPFISDEGHRFPAATRPLSPTTHIGQTILHGQPLLIHRTAEELAEMATGSPTGLGNANRPSASLIYVPMKSEQKVLGALSVQSYQLNAYLPQHITLLTRIADQLTLALQNAQLFTQIQNTARQLTTLNHFGQAVTQQLDVASVLETTYAFVQRLTAVDAFFIALHDAASQQISFPLLYDAGRRYYQDSVPLRATSHTGRVVITGQPVLILETAESLAAMTEVGGALGDVDRPSASLLYVPLQAGATVLGVLSVQSYQLNAYSDDDVQLLSTVGTQVGTAIQTARLFQQTQQVARHEQALREITARVRSSTDPDTIVRAAVRELGQALERSAFIRLGAAEQLRRPPEPPAPSPLPDNGQVAEGGR
jgi:PAS domain S-box-containing protein